MRQSAFLRQYQVTDILPINEIVGAKNGCTWQAVHSQGGVVVCSVVLADVEVGEIFIDDWVSESICHPRSSVCRIE